MFILYIPVVSAKDFYYTNQGSSIEISGVDDKTKFNNLCQALQQLGFHNSEQKHLFKLLAAVLHLGNVIIHTDTEKDSGEESYIDCQEKNIGLVASLLGIERDELRKQLYNKKIKAVHKTLVKPLTTSQVYVGLNVDILGSKEQCS